MKKTISFYSIPKDMKHNTKKLFCFNWEYEKDPNEIENEINDRIIEKNINTDFYGEYNWCSKCKMFKYGFDSSIDKFIITHDYNDPIWYSEWNIKHLKIGSYKTTFSRKFCYNRGIREINYNDIICAISEINYFDELLRTSDKLAYEETYAILQKLKEWTKKDVFILIEEKN